MFIGSTLVSCIVLAIFTTAVTGTNFCDEKKLCRHGGPHICCNRKGFDSCCQNAKLVPMTPSRQALILELLNGIRQKVASGKVNRHAPAKKMGYVSWNSELAYLATCNVHTCKYGHDICRNTPGLPHVGQNIFISHDSDKFLNVEDAIREGFRSWIDEYKDSNMKVINSGKTTGVGHFTQCVHDRATSVGCAYGQYTEGGEYNSYFVCDFNETNMGPVYAAGSSGADCQTGHHPKYTALCNKGEKYGTTANAHAKAFVRKH